MWRINSVEEITTTTTESYSDEDDDDQHYHPYRSLNFNDKPIKVPFPEAGVDIIDINYEDLLLNNDSDLTHESGIKCIECQNWEENWLFKKGKRYDNKSNIMYGYMAMILAELPVCMLVPNPIDKLRTLVGNKDIDELSDLSEHNSVGSLEFSDDESDTEDDVINESNVNNDVTTIDTNDTNKSESQTKSFDNECNERKIVVICKVVNTTTKEYNNNTKPTETTVNKEEKPIVKTVTKVPNYLPKELRNTSSDDKSDPYLVLRPGDASVHSGITVQFCCRAKGSKPLLYSWFKNDVILNSDKDFHIFQSGEESILEIMNTSPNFSDQYSCVAYNSFGYQWCDFVLEVKNINFLTNKMPIKLKNIRQQNIVNCEDNHDNQPNNDETGDIPEPLAPQMSCAIAEREHKKWENPDIDWKDNPYSIENLNSRIQQRSISLSLANESSIEKSDDNNEDNNNNDNLDENEDNISFLSSTSKDVNRYKKDYYVKQLNNNNNKEETLRSFDENEYSNSKYFELPAKQQTRKSSEDMSSQMSSITSNGKTSAETESELIYSDCDQKNIPSVKDLVNKFSFSDQRNHRTPKLFDIKRKNSFTDIKLNHISKNTSQSNNFTVHSLTARSMTREFRQRSQLNVPRSQLNRMDINSHNNRNVNFVESESSSPSTPCSPTNDGYTSDDSSIISSNGNLSSNVVNDTTGNGIACHKNNLIHANNDRKYSPSILKRATYWQKRCENGLLSDYSVAEEFPPMESFVD
ncbi:homeobox protein 2-like isoform X2 [Oppia nitens]|uniref:homeobox protein 2-like isoform X2 n=1 Tax=Oppia nitens TaxID=1686743 RepID=UPI0023DB1281|nr:homeobox protein 2-like isoform X2 [Oppia nitens]